MSQYRSNWSFHIPLKIYLRHLTICWARGYSIYVGLCSLCSRLRKGAGDWYWWEKGNESGERRSPFPALFALFSLSPCPSSVLRLKGRLWATWVCAAQQGMVFAPLALKQRIKNTLLSLLSLLSLPKNRWHYWGSFSARLLSFLRVSSSRFTNDVRGRVANSNRNRPRASKTQRHTSISVSTLPPFPQPRIAVPAGVQSPSMIWNWIGKGRENKRRWLDSQLSFSDDVK